jgi:hypothetical protein
MPESKANLDDEMAAIATIANIANGLAPEVRERVIRYVADRFEIRIGSGRRTSDSLTAATSQETSESAGKEFAEFAALFDACNPKTDSQRALAAAFWLQICQGGANFDSQAANTELKHLGHGVANITRALDPLIQQKPALILQIRKSGNTRQARKLYKITEAGIRKVRALIAGTGDDQ